MAANPNTIPLQTTWSREYQLIHWKIPVYPAITNYRLLPDLEKGDTVKRTYARQFIANAMGGGGEFTRQVIVDTEETLDIDQEYDASFYIKELDEIQSHLPTRQRYARNAATALHQRIDAHVLGSYSAFSAALDASYFGGTSGNAIELTSANVPQIFSGVNLLLQRASIFINIAAKFSAVKVEDPMDMGVAVISPDFQAKIVERLEGKASALGDSVGVQGNVGKYMGYNLFVSNALAWTGTLSLVTQPSDGDVVTVNGVTMTFKTTIGTTAGNVLIGGSADAARANLAALITAGGVTTDSGVSNVSVSATPDSSGFSDRDRLNNIVATNSNSLDTMTIVALGKGYVPVTKTLTDATDGWVTGKSMQHCLIGVANAIDLVVRVAPKMDIRKRDGFVGSDIVTWTAWGKKVFQDGITKMVDVKISTETYSGASGN
jgi:hypothetical protein